jgi:hypothetical protein
MIISFKIDKIITKKIFCGARWPRGGAQWPRGQCARRAIAEAKQRWLTNSMVSHRIGDQNLLTQAPPCFGRHVKPICYDKKDMLYRPQLVG